MFEALGLASGLNDTWCILLRPDARWKKLAIRENCRPLLVADHLFAIVYQFNSLRCVAVDRLSQW